MVVISSSFWIIEYIKIITIMISLELIFKKSFVSNVNKMAY